MINKATISTMDSLRFLDFHPDPAVVSDGRTPRALL
jgi:hypothetical protein